MKSSVIEDHNEKTKTITRYDYALHLFRSRRRETKRIISDSCSLLSRPRERAVALGRRTLVQDEGSTLMRTLYDGMSFDIIREQESFADGYFTNTSDTYVDWQTSGGESASRYRYIGEEAGSQGQNSGQAGSQGPNPSNFHANSNADYRLVSPNRSRSSVTLFAKKVYVCDTASEQVRAFGFGAGMGLPNTKRVSDLFHINSKPGKNTTVRVQFNLSQEPETE
jgi:hypothetical protein